MSSFKDKVVLVTGACGGMGKEISKLFAMRKASLVLVDMREADLKKIEENCRENGSPEVLSISANLTIKEDIDGIIEKTIQHFKRIDVLVNNAGILMEYRLEDTSWEDFDNFINVNTKAPFFLAKGFIPELRKTEGCIVNTSSMAGQIPAALCTAYCISKAGVDHLTRCLAQENAKFGVRVNSVNPGIVNTPLTGSDENPTRLRLFANSTQPLGGIIQPIKIAQWIVHLASEEAGPITGQCIIVDAGNQVTRIPKGFPIPGQK